MMRNLYLQQWWVLENEYLKNECVHTYIYTTKNKQFKGIIKRHVQNPSGQNSKDLDFLSGKTLKQCCLKPIDSDAKLHPRCHARTKG